MANNQLTCNIQKAGVLIHGNFIFVQDYLGEHEGPRYKVKGAYKARFLLLCYVSMYVAHNIPGINLLYRILVLQLYRGCAVTAIV